MITIQNSLLFLCVLLSSLIMGLLYGYACSVNPGLNRLTDTEYIKAMQSINIQIQNPAFFLSFVGTLFILPISTWHSRTHASPACFYLLLAATLFYLIGVIGVTAFGNIPLNNALAKFTIANANAGEIMRQRNAFEARWNSLHLVRTLCSFITTSLSILAAMKK